MQNTITLLIRDCFSLQNGCRLAKSRHPQYNCFCPKRPPTYSSSPGIWRLKQWDVGGALGQLFGRTTRQKEDLGGQGREFRFPSSKAEKINPLKDIVEMF